MLRISTEQKAFFDRAAFDEFVSRSAARIADEFRTDAECMGTDGLAAFVRHGLARAGRHAIEDEHGVDLYLNLMLLLGAELDVDPQLRWVAPVLAARRAHVAPLAVRLDAAARAYLVAVAGRDHQHAQAALRRLASARREDLPDAEPALVDWLSLIYPQKVAYLEGPGISDLVERTRSAAAVHGLGEVSGHALYAALSLAFGSGFERDPALPWAPRALREARAAAYDARSATLLERLRNEIQRYLR